MSTRLIIHFQTLGKQKFYGGNSITMIDYMMWPWFERLEMFELKQYVLLYFQIQDIDVASIHFGQCILHTVSLSPDVWMELLS